VRPDILRQIWPVFVAEAHEHVAAIGAAVLELERSPGNAEGIEAVRRTAHGLKGSAASLGLTDLELVAHGIEGVLAGFDPAFGLERVAVRAILDALAGIEAALAAADAGNEPHIAGRDALLGALRSALSSTGPGRRLTEAAERLVGAVERLCAPLAPDERRRIADEASAVAAKVADGASGRAAELTFQVGIAFAELGAADENEATRVAARLAGDVLELRDMLAEQPAGPTHAAGEAAAPASGELAPRVEKDERAVRVLGSTLDSLARQVDMLALAESRHGRRARELAEAERALREAIAAMQGAGQALRAAGVDAGRPELELAAGRLYALGGDLRRISREGQREAEQQRLTGALLREDLRALRMVPAALALESAARAVREAALRLGKEVKVRIEGGDVRLDRRLVEDLRAPLLHLVRNAVDHGIEPVEVRRAAGKPAAGTVVIRVEPRGSRVGVAVEDDGGGLDLAAIKEVAVRAKLLGAEEAEQLTDAEAARWVFAPGLSTARSVTTVSGRGVGLDAVADAMARMRGAVEVKSERGVGTRFELDLPLTLAAAAGVIVRVGDVTAIVPADAVERVLLLDSFVDARPGATVRVGDAVHPFAALAETLGIGRAPPPGRAIGLVLALGSQHAVVAVDEVLGEQEVVVSALGGLASRVAHLAGASLMDDGRVLGVLAPGEILRRIGPAAVPVRSAARGGLTAVVADDTLASRTLMASLLEAAGYSVRLAPDGDAALALVEEGPCDVVVSDVQMPRMDGLALTRRLRADPRWRRVPVILVSTLDGPADVEAGTAAGADAYLSKRDLANDALVRLVRSVLGEERAG
jgi:two-component system chemotaxis sensor kinase CheA